MVLALTAQVGLNFLADIQHEAYYHYHPTEH